MPGKGAIALKPANLTHDEMAALSFGGMMALDFFNRAKIQRGERVLINGASGAVGAAAVQLVRHFGGKVTGVCSTANVELVRSLDAVHVIDYTKEDFTQNCETYDIIVDAVGTAPFSRGKASLQKGSPAVAYRWAASNTRRESAFSRGAGRVGRVQISD